MVTSTEIDRIDEALKDNNELASSRFVQRLNAHIYSPGWGDTMRDTLQALCTVVTPRFPVEMAKDTHGRRQPDSTGRWQAGSNADDAFRNARRNLIGAIVEYEERREANNPRNPMEIMRDKRVAEQQLVDLICYTGFMGTELAREHVRTFERLVKAQMQNLAPQAAVSR